MNSHKTNNNIIRDRRKSIARFALLIALGTSLGTIFGNISIGISIGIIIAGAVTLYKIKYYKK